MRTLHVIDRLDKRLGGAMQAALGICHYLQEAGQRVEVAGSFEPGDVLDHLDNEFEGLTIHRFARTFPRRFANSSPLADWLPGALERFQLVEIHTVFSLFTWRAARACRRAGVPYLVRPHGSLDPFDLRKRAWLKRVTGPSLVRPMLQGAAALVLTATREAELLETFGARVRKVVMPLPVPVPKETGDGRGFRLRHGIPENARVVLFLSRIDYKKGLDLLIPALGRLRAELPDLRFILAGSGEPGYAKQVASWLDLHGLRGCSTLVGFVSGKDKRDAFAAADVFALPSRNENFGIAIIEAMHAGLSLLVSDQVYISDEISRAQAGIVCRTTVSSVTDGLRSLLMDIPAGRVMGRNGRRLVEGLYRPEAATEALLELYQSVLRRSHGRGGAVGVAGEKDQAR